MPGRTIRRTQSSCELTADPAKRAAAYTTTEPLKAALPPGMSQPSLRALLHVGVGRLEDLTRFSESQLRQLHGMGPKALGILSGALKKKGLSFRP